VICYNEERSDEIYCPLVTSLLVLLLRIVASLSMFVQRAVVALFVVVVFFCLQSRRF